MEGYREVFCREAGFNHVSRYINGLLLSANKTLQGIYAQIVWAEGKKVSRRAMHESVSNSRNSGNSQSESSGWNRSGSPSAELSERRISLFKNDPSR